MIKGLIFDLDGTLLDTIDDIAQAMNDALQEMGLNRHSLEEYKVLVGSGIKNLAESVLPPEYHNPEGIEGFIGTFREHYARSWHNKTKPYSGIVEMLNLLRATDLRLAILSNKSQRFTAAMADYWFMAEGKQTFDPVWGERAGIPVKPNPQAALAIAEQWGLSPQEIAFIGDSDVDMQTAVNAGMLAIGVEWGFRSVAELLESGAQCILQKPEELLKHI